MKLYVNSNGLRMVGKSWQIRAKLKELSRTTLTVQQFLQYSKSVVPNQKESQLRVIKS